MDAESEADSTSGGGHNLSDTEDVKYGIRQSRRSVSSTRRSSSALYPGQIMTMEFMLSVAELSLSQCFMLAFIVALLGIHKHRLVSQLRQWQSMGDVPEETMVATVAMVDKLKNVLKHVMFLMDWV